MPATQKTLIRRAEQRAAISAYLAQHPGRVRAGVVAAALKLPPTGAGRMMAHMATAGLISSDGGSKGKTEYWASEEKAPRAVRAVVLQNTAAPREYTNGQPQGVEFVVGGVLVTVDRNPSTGRLRVAFDQS